jgi:extradiol dioxygenase family protein
VSIEQEVEQEVEQEAERDDPGAAMGAPLSHDLPRFHLAFPVHDLAAAREFYGGLLGCPEGRSSEHWVDFDFHGHQIVAHLVRADASGPQPTPGNTVDGDQVPARHFGVILDWESWEDCSRSLAAAGVEFFIQPHVRFVGQVGEQATMFFSDPSGNALEIKAFRHPSAVFARD